MTHWCSGAAEDWTVASELIDRDRIRHGLFFAHLALEKTLKGLICKRTLELAPPIHNLVRLAQLARVSLSEEKLDLLAEVNEFNIEGRYPEMQLPMPSQVEAQNYLSRIAEVLEWLKQQF